MWNLSWVSKPDVRTTIVDRWLYLVLTVLSFSILIFIFKGTGSVEGGCKCLQINRTSAGKAGSRGSKCKCSQENWIYLCWIVRYQLYVIILKLIVT